MRNENLIRLKKYLYGYRTRTHLNADVQRTVAYRRS